MYVVAAGNITVAIIGTQNTGCLCETVKNNIFERIYNQVLHVIYLRITFS